MIHPEPDKLFCIKKLLEHLCSKGFLFQQIGITHQNNEAENMFC